MTVSTLSLSRDRLPAHLRVVLAGEILIAYLRARWWLRERDFRRTLDRLAVPAGTGPGEADAASRRLARAVLRTLALLPTDSRCLVSSVVLSMLLARRGIDSRLVLGVRPGTQLQAHAWVERGGIPLLDPAGFEPLFPN